MLFNHFPSIQVLSHYIQVLSSVWLSSKATACTFQHSRALDFAFYCLKGWAKLHNVNVIFNQIDVFLVILHWYCVFALRFQYLDGVGLFAMGTASLKPQNLQTMTLITQHKPINRSTDMVSRPKNLKFSSWKTCMGSAWLQGMFMHGGVPASRHPWW